MEKKRETSKGFNQKRPRILPEKKANIRDSTEDTGRTEHNTEILRTARIEKIYTYIYTDNGEKNRENRERKDNGEKRKKDRLRVWNLSGILQRPQTVKTNVDFTEYKTFSQHPLFSYIYFPR